MNLVWAKGGAKRQVGLMCLGRSALAVVAFVAAMNLG
jgi:hypothetical protein